MITNLTILWEAFHNHFIPWSKELILSSGEDFAGRPVSVLLLSTVTKGLDQPVLLSLLQSRKNFLLFVSFHI